MPTRAVGGKRKSERVSERRNATGPDPGRSWVPRGARRGGPDGNAPDRHLVCHPRALQAEFRPAGAAVARDARAAREQDEKYRASDVFPRQWDRRAARTLGCATLTPLKVVARRVRAARALGAVTRGARVATGATMAAMVACVGVMMSAERDRVWFLVGGDFLAPQSRRSRNGGPRSIITHFFATSCP